MSHFTKFALLALLALPFGKAFAGTDTLNVNITVTISANIDVVFNSGSAISRAWTLSAVAFNTDYVSDTTGAIDIEIKNQTAGIDSVKVTAAVTSPGSWFLDQVGSGNTGVKDHFSITTADLGSGALKLTNVPQLYIPALGATPTSGNKLTFHTPTTVSTVNSGTITVTFVAAAN